MPTALHPAPAAPVRAPSMRIVVGLGLVLTLAACASSSSSTDLEDPASSDTTDTTDTTDTAADVATVDLDHGALQLAVDRSAERAGGWGASVLGVRVGGAIPFAGAAGERVRDGDPMTSTDAFEVASVTKTFTAALILGMVDDGLIGLEDPLTSLLPDDTPTGLADAGGVDRTGEVTLRQLLNHTSGIPDYWSDPPFVRNGNNQFILDFLADDDRHWTFDELIPYAVDLRPPGPPGEQWHYSDTNYVLLGMIAEAHLGEPYASALRRRVLDPLGLDHTWMVWDEVAPDVPLVARYEGRRDLTQYAHQSADQAGGGLASTTEDLLDFADGVASGALFSAALFDAMLDPVVTGEGQGVGYGLGVFVVELDEGGVIWGHDGYGGAFLYSRVETGASWAGSNNQTDADAEILQSAVVREVLAAEGE
jgi:D-alanyl-D-alanine carboxypeptidase